MSRRDLLIALAFLALAALFLAPVTFGGASLVPFDNLFRFPPWSTFASQFGVTTPHNELVSDLLLENYAWKKFIVDSLQAHEIPLWNPHLFAGVPFLAAGQNSALYPFSLLFYILPVDRAFGYFVALQLAIAALAMYALMRVHGLSRFAASLSGIVFAFSGFMIVSTAFPMILSAAAWLPAILACVELVVRARSDDRKVFFALVGAVLVGIQFLAGHIEISIYTLIVTAFYALWRVVAARRPPADRPAQELAAGADARNATDGSLRYRVRNLLLVGGMTVLGTALGAILLAPMFELVENNFRSGSVNFQDVLGWAYPPRQLVTFLIPDFFGNPTSHSYFDVFDLTNHRAPFGTIFWGVKNYVEAGAYVGILPLALALVACIAALRHYVSRRSGTPSARGVPSEQWPSLVALFAVLSVLSLFLIFPTGLYAVLFYLVPGFNQLHTPFRWVFPLTLSVAALAGIGVERLVPNDAGLADSGRLARLFRVVRNDAIGWLLVFLGSATLLGLAATWLLRDQTLGVADRVLRSSHLAQLAFDSGRMFYSYEFRNVFVLAIFLVGAGAVIRISRCPIYLPARLGRAPVWKPLALAIVVADLFVFGMGFYTAADPGLADFTPPAVTFLQQDKSLYRITSYDARGGPGEKVFNPNVGMFYGIDDIRGYDSIIPKTYADLMGLLAPQDELLDNRIAPFYGPDPLSSPILNLLNVKYVLTKRPVPNAGYTLVYDGEIKIYRNDRVLPRAFMVPEARVVADRAAQLEQMKSLDPAKQVLLDEVPPAEAGVVDATRSAGGPNCTLDPVTIDQYDESQVVVKSVQACSGWLVLSDSYFPGWIAQIDGQDVPLLRGDYNFRTVLVPAGEHTIRFKYSPLSFRVGAISSFLAAMVLLLGLAYLAWRRFYHVDEASQVRTVAKNSLLPMATSLVMKAFPFALALLSLRILGPTGTGRYAWAVTVFFFASTITDFGLGILVTREVSRDLTQANRYLTNTIVLRVILWALALVPFGLMPLIYHVTPDTTLTFGLLMVGLLPSSLSASLAFLFNAYERFEYRVAVDFMTQVLSFALQAVALLLGFGIVGLASASIATNLFTLGVFYYLVRRSLFVPRLELDRSLIRWMFFESYPLMLNNLLSSLFFRIDVLILQPLKGDAVVGYYKTAYSFIDNLNFIPSNFTLAIFPALTRYAASAKDAMLRAYILSLKLLLWIALPITAGTIFVSRELITIIGGTAYLPDSALALQVLIWFLPFSFINSVTHYVLIALGQQRFLTKAFVIGLIFNVAANLVAIRSFSYMGAAFVTILSEIVLLIPFYYGVRRHLASIPFWSIAWRPIVSAAVMGVALWGLVSRVSLLVAVPAAGLLYVVLLVALGALGEDERALLRRLVPTRWHAITRLAPREAKGT